MWITIDIRDGIWGKINSRDVNMALYVFVSFIWHDIFLITLIIVDMITLLLLAHDFLLNIQFKYHITHFTSLRHQPPS